MPQQISDWTDVTNDWVDTPNDWIDVSPQKQYQDTPSILGGWLDTFNKYDKPLLDVTKYTDPLAEYQKQTPKPLAQALLASDPFGIGQFAQSVEHYLHPTNYDPANAMSMETQGAGRFATDMSRPSNIAMLGGSMGASAAARYGLPTAAKYLTYGSRLASVPITASGIRDVHTEMTSEDPWTMERAARLGMGGVEAIGGYLGMRQHIPETFDPRVTPPAPPPTEPTQLGLFPKSTPFEPSPAGITPDVGFTPPPADPPAIVRARAMAAIDAETQRKTFELEVRKSEASRNGDHATATALDNEILQTKMDNSVTKRNWQPPVVQEAPAPVFPDMSGAVQEPLETTLGPNRVKGRFAPESPTEYKRIWQGEPFKPPASAEVPPPEVPPAPAPGVEDIPPTVSTYKLTPDDIKTLREKGYKSVPGLRDANNAPVMAHNTVDPTIAGEHIPEPMPEAWKQFASETPRVPTSTETVRATEGAQLPHELKGATPRHGKYELQFNNDLDKALYIIAKETPSNRDADYLKFVMDHLGLNETDARALGKEVKGAITNQVKGQPEGMVKLNQIFEPPEPPATNTPVGSRLKPGDTTTIPKNRLTKTFIDRLKEQGIQLVGKDAKGNGIFKRLAQDTSGEFTPQEMWNNLKKLFGREPTPEEVNTAMERQPKPGETTGRVAPFARPGEVRPMDVTSPKDIALDRANDFAEARSITDLKTAEENVKHWQEKLNAAKLAGNTDAVVHADGILGVAQRQWAKLRGQAGIPLTDKPLPGEVPGPVGVLRTKAQLDRIASVPLGESTNLGQKPSSFRDFLNKIGGSDETGAVQFGGKATPDSIMGKLFKESSKLEELKARVKGGAPKEQSYARQLYELTRGITTTMDLSAALRQGLPLVFSKAWRNSLRPMIEALGSDGAYRKIMEDIKSRDMFARGTDFNTGRQTKSFAEQAGLELMDMHEKLGMREETIASKWAETGEMFGKDTTLQRGYAKSVGRGAAASNRAYTTFLNKLRADTFESLVNDAARDFNAGTKGVRNPHTDLAFAKEIADYVNTATGRGPLRLAGPRVSGGLGIREYSFNKAAHVLTNTVFAPRLMFSRMRMLNPATYVMASPFVRQQYLKSAFSVVGFATGMAMLGKMGGADVSMDPANADFLKLKFGDTRLDPMGGFQQFVVPIYKILSGKYTSSNTQREGELGVGYKAETMRTVAERFAVNKLHPVIKFGWDLMDASEHQPFSVGDRAAQLFLPLIVGDVLDIARKDPNLLPMIAPIALGMGSQTYDKGETENKFLPRQYDYQFKGNIGNMFK